ncbi:transposase [Cardinium endosymbiont of Tipula unca]|uniref:transposase n=1 Tax=Cardinium endosymbiont of Tipula unca TaxID=3066216 RepID=UPI003BAFE8BF
MLQDRLDRPYWQYFCGYEYFQWKLPCDPSSLTRWRKRLGEEGLNKIDLLRKYIRFLLVAKST